jgi:hypothetical protein
MRLVDFGDVQRQGGGQDQSGYVNRRGAGIVDEKLEVVVIPSEADANWPAWYARYMVAEQAGTELPV